MEFFPLSNTDDIFSSDHGCSAESLVDGSDLVHGSSDQRGASVSDGLTPTITEAGLNTRISVKVSHNIAIYISELDPVHGELPVSLPGDRDIGEVSGVVLGVAATEDDLPSILRGWVPVEVEAEQGVLHQALADHVVEGRHHAVHCNVGVAHAEDSVKLGRHEGHARLGQSLGEGLVLDVDSAE